MGGLGSGQRWSSKKTTSCYLRMDIRKWRRDGLVLPLERFFCGGWRVDVDRSSGPTGNPERLILSNLDYRSEHCPVALAWTACNYGGWRPWFLCPVQGCGRRVAILYGARAVACRHCRRLAYLTQQLSRTNRALHLAAEIRTQLGASSSLAEDFPEKPSGMHWRRYRRLYARAERLERIFFGGFLGSLESACFKFDDRS